MGKPGQIIQDYVDRAFGRFVDLRAEGEPPLTPWTPPPAAGLARVEEHLADRYGVVVKKLTPLDCGVYRLDRGDGSSWVARVFPRARSVAAVKADAEVLRFLESHDFPSERLADDAPISEVDGHRILVTAFVAGKPPGGTAVTGKWQGDALGRLHTLPLEGAPKRAGGGWHSLSLDGGGRAADFAILFELLDDLRRIAPPTDRKHVDALVGALEATDLCEDLPQCLVHVDFGGPNLLKSPDGSFTVIDWTGSGRGPRIESVAAVLGPLPATAQKAAIAAYRQHVQPTDDELGRLEGTLL
ncbi:MAG TPA: phosphotransferase, partial [Acidimicrobiales bacterium]|nr:phosphotransferase [Acidimicrobiales bacterium]